MTGRCIAMIENMKITFTGGGNLGEELFLPLDAPVLVGRSHSASIRFRESDVSGKHLEISRSGDGVMALNISRYKAMVNGTILQPGESCPVNPGDVFAFGSKARFRIDALGVSGDSPTGGSTDGGADGATLPGDGETKAMTQGGTFATRMPNSADMTYATRPAPFAADVTFATRMPSKSFNTTFATRPAPDAEVIMASAPSDLDPDATGMISTGVSSGAAGFADTPTGMLEPSTQTGASEADGATQVMQTRAGSMDEIERHKKLMAQKKRVRRSLMAAATVLFLAMLGTVVWIRWPKSELVLSVPLKAGTDDPDIAHHVMKSEAGANAFVVDFPVDAKRMKKSGDGDGPVFFVSTFTGRDRDVPFRLKASRRRDKAEMRLSLEDSFSAKKSELASGLGVDFLSPAEWPAGVFFFELEHPQSCVIRLQRGTRFARSEYLVDRDGVKWHGIFILIRDHDTIYTVEREIPESEWPRGKWLLRADSNIQLYPAFMRSRWESPGEAQLIKGRSERELVEYVTHELDRKQPRVSEWFSIKKALDTLVVLTWGRRDADVRTVADCLKRFRAVQDRTYRRFMNEFEVAKINAISGSERQTAIRDDCRSVFSADPSDMRFILSNDPEKWPCLEKK